MHATTKRTGFSLIELLIVMAVIMLLAAMSMPMYHRYRARAYAAKCSYNLRSIGIAFNTYQSEWKGWMPYALDNKVEQTADKGRAVRWKYALSYYLGSHTAKELQKRSYPLHEVFFDPIKGKGEGNYFISLKHFGTRIEVMKLGAGGASGWAPYSEWEYGWVDTPSGRKWTAQKEISPQGYMRYETWKSPATAAIITESKSPTIQRAMGKEGKGTKATVNIEYRHMGYANVLFLDGHVQDFQSTDQTVFDFFDKKLFEAGERIRQID